MPAVNALVPKVKKADEDRPVLLSPELVGQTVTKGNGSRAWCNRQRTTVQGGGRGHSTGIAVEVVSFFIPMFLSCLSDLPHRPPPCGSQRSGRSLLPLVIFIPHLYSVDQHLDFTPNSLLCPVSHVLSSCLV